MRTTTAMQNYVEVFLTSLEAEKITKDFIKLAMRILRDVSDINALTQMTIY